VYIWQQRRDCTAVIKELSQLHMRDVLEPQIPEEFTPSAKAAALEYLMS